MVRDNEGGVREQCGDFLFYYLWFWVCKAWLNRCFIRRSPPTILITSPRCDPSAYGCKTYIGTDLKEMPDGHGGPLMRDGTHVFELHFKDGVEMQVWVSAAVGSERAAAKQVAKIQ